MLAACGGESGTQSRKSTSDTTAADVQSDDPVAELTDLISENPNDPNLYVRRALLYRTRGMFELAMRDIERASSFDPNSSYFHFLRGETEFQRNSLRDARLALETAIQLDPTNTDALLLLGEVHYLQFRYDQALTTINDALRVDEYLAQGYFLKGFIYRELNNPTLEVSSFQTAVEVDPEFYQAYIELGTSYGRQGNPIALQYFETALELRPKSAEAYYLRGMFLQAGNKFDEALENYRDMLEFDPDNPLGYYNIGYIYLTEKMAFDTALAYFDSTLAIRPDYVDAIVNRGVCYEELGMPDRAEREYALALEMDPQHDMAARGLSRIREGG